MEKGRIGSPQPTRYEHGVDSGIGDTHPFKRLDPIMAWFLLPLGCNLTQPPTLKRKWKCAWNGRVMTLNSTMRWVALAPAALLGALLGYAIVYFAFLVILQMFGDPAPAVVRAFVTRSWASMTFAGFAIIVAEEVAPAGRDHVSKWVGGILLATAAVMSGLGVALREMGDLACAGGLVVGTFMTWAARSAGADRSLFAQPSGLRPAPSRSFSRSPRRASHSALTMLSPLERDRLW